MRSPATAEASSAIGRIVALAARTRADEARQRSQSTDPKSYDEIFRRTAESANEIQKRIARERKHGQAQWLVLERHPQPRRLVMIRNDRRLHTWGLYQILLERSRGLASQNPRGAVQMAELALAVARCLDPEIHGEERTADFQAAALAALADAKRRLADREGAWGAYEAARECLEEGTGDPLERAELEILRARLLRDFGPEEEAERSLRRAGRLLRRIGDKRPEQDLLDDTAHGVVQRRARG
jgi:tetratricopeptide (TPR) repeat protein